MCHKSEGGVIKYINVCLNVHVQLKAHQPKIKKIYILYEHLYITFRGIYHGLFNVYEKRKIELNNNRND